MTLSDLAVMFFVASLAYFVVWNVHQFAMGVVAAASLLDYLKYRTSRGAPLLATLASPPHVSIVVPARNEALTIVTSVRALLAVDYAALEIVVVNDGSTDDTLTTLQKSFALVTAPVAFEQPLKVAPVRAIYRSVEQPSLIVIDKESAGCKADATNAGINASSGALVLVIDADTVLEPDALTRAVLPFIQDTRTVAVGGYVGLANGCRIEDGSITKVGLPRGWLLRFQVVEYMRSFLLFRLACASRNAVTIVSGAFGLFRRDALLEVGGFDPTAIGEDMDLTVRLQLAYRRQGRPIRVAYIPWTVCWTQAPSDLASLRSQRYRWRRGLLQVLWRHRQAMIDPRSGFMGMVVLPYTAIFDGVGPIIEVASLAIAAAAAVMGVLNWEHLRVLLAVSLLFGGATTMVAVFLSDAGTRHYGGLRDLLVLILASFLENIGYRQLNSWWTCLGTVQAMTGRGGWGTLRRERLE